MTRLGTLLIADDEPILCEQLVYVLSSLGAPIITAKDGKELLERVLDTPDVTAILSDIQMPEMNGMEVLREIRSRGIETPVVFLTGFGDKDMVVEALRFGAMDFLEKPYSTENLRAVMSQALELGARIRQIDHDLNELASKYKIPAGEVARFKEIQRPVLLMKAKSKVFFQKKVS
jgi:two-component system response regulator FixJ